MYTKLVEIKISMLFLNLEIKEVNNVSIFDEYWR